LVNIVISEIENFDDFAKEKEKNSPEMLENSVKTAKTEFKSNPSDFSLFKLLSAYKSFVETKWIALNEDETRTENSEILRLLQMGENTLRQIYFKKKEKMKNGKHK